MDLDQAAGISRVHERIFIKSVRRRSMEGDALQGRRTNKRYKQARWKRGGGAGGLQPHNNLLSLVDFVSEKATEATVLGMKIRFSNSEIYEEATRIYQKCHIF